jgi:gliding motility-associated protein GldM
MAGGKETPRQKMIGLMYLVLMTLLALNVSKEIIDAFVSIDNNVQEANFSVRSKGNDAFSTLQEISLDKSDVERAKIAQKWFKIAQEIRLLTEKHILFIDQLKIELLEAVGEDVSSIILNKESIPMLLDLAEVKNKDKYDDPMRILIGPEINLRKPTGKGMDVWLNRIEYRNKLTEFLGTYTSLDNAVSYTFSAENSDNFLSCHPDDTLIIRQLYKQLTKVEYRKVHDLDGVHWVGSTFDHAPVVAAIAQLSSIQTELLNAEAEALSHIRSKIGGGEYSFNKVMALAYGNSYLNLGDSLNMEVLMAAYDSYKTPVVSYIDPNTGESIQLSDANYFNGKGIFNFLPKRIGSDTLKGTIAIQNKSGQWKTENWFLPYTVGKPVGAISSPKMNILYKGYDNELIGAVSGFTKCKLVGVSNVTLTSIGNDKYTASPGSGRKAIIRVLGLDENNKATTLGDFEYEVKSLPRPLFYLGSVVEGSKIAYATLVSQMYLFLKYDASFPITNVNFDVLDWTLQVGSNPRIINGYGKTLTSDAIQLIRQARNKDNVIFSCWIKDPSNAKRKISASFEVQR